MVTRRAAAVLALAGALLLVPLPGAARAPHRAGPAAAYATGTVALPAAHRAARPLLRPGGVAAARRWAAGREGTVAWAVADESGRVRGHRVSQAFPSASVSKAMLLVATLRAARDRPLSAAEKGLLRPMVTVSDNDAADAVYARVGGAALTRLARRARMTHFRDVGYWSDAQVSPADQARLFHRLDALLPPRHRGYGRELLRSVVSYQRWGMPGVARRSGLRILFKGGWRRGLTHQVARLERPGSRRHVAVAVMTLDAPSMAYAEATIAGIAARLLTPAA